MIQLFAPPRPPAFASGPIDLLCSELLAPAAPLRALQPARRLKVSSALHDDTAPSVFLDYLKAPAAPTHSRA